MTETSGSQPPGWDMRRTVSSRAVQGRLAAEVLRKLSLAASADRKEDRDIICSEVFADITGDLNSAAQGSTGTLYTRWYEVLAPYFCADEGASEALLSACRRLWGQPFTTPTFALLLHQWLLVHPGAGGADQRLKYLNVLVSGARQLFVGDAETGSAAFAPMFSFLAERVVLSPGGARLAALPETGREAVMALAASFAPYYLGPSGDYVTFLDSFPAPSAVSAGRPPPRDPGRDGGRREGVDFALDRAVEALAREVTAEPGVLAFLAALRALGGTGLLGALRTSTRIRLQAELYALTQPGGPRYASRAVNRAAFRALDALFPRGRRARRLVNAAFRVLHPGEWPWLWWDALWDGARAVRAWARLAGRAARGLWARLAARLRWRPGTGRSILCG
ncbi:hypothetical protein ACKKBF_B18875 [Auxenochlorella protothecoides x Auxenochlorella symbiontica]